MLPLLGRAQPTALKSFVHFARAAAPLLLLGALALPRPAWAIVDLTLALDGGAGIDNAPVEEGQATTSYHRSAWNIRFTPGLEFLETIRFDLGLKADLEAKQFAQDLQEAQQGANELEDFQKSVERCKGDPTLPECQKVLAVCPDGPESPQCVQLATTCKDNPSDKVCTDAAEKLGGGAAAVSKVVNQEYRLFSVEPGVRLFPLGGFFLRFALGPEFVKAEQDLGFKTQWRVILGAGYELVFAGTFGVFVEGDYFRNFGGAENQPVGNFLEARAGLILKI